MAYCVPPVVTDTGGNPELFLNGVSGFVVPPRDAQAIADAVETLYRDAAPRQRMGEAARQRIANDFRNEDTVRKTVAFYEELVPDSD